MSMSRIVFALIGCAVIVLTFFVATSATIGSDFDNSVRRVIATAMIGSVGATLVLGALTYDGKGDFFAWTPGWVRILNGVLLVCLFGSFASFFLWEGAGPGERDFTSRGGIGLGPIGFSFRDPNPNQTGRVIFTTAGIVIWIMVLAGVAMSFGSKRKD